MNFCTKAVVFVLAISACGVDETGPAPPVGPNDGAVMQVLPTGPDGGPSTPTGDSSVGQEPVKPLLGAAISVGAFATCVIDDQSTVRCFGRCGPNGGGGMRNTAPPGLKARSVAVGRSFACAILAEALDGSVVRCWGGAPADSAPKTTDAVEIAASDDHACIRGASGVVTCWGGTGQDAPAGLVAKALAVSGAMNCAVASDDSVRCWGLRVADPPADLRAKQIAVNSQLADPANGPRFGCAVGLGDDVRCWGDDPGGVQTIPAGQKAQAVGAARGFACAIDLGGQLVCWGTLPRFGQPLPAGVTAKQLSMTFRTAGAVLADRTFTFWGDVSDERGTPPAGAHAP
jgi:hypothetical protein